LRTRQRKRASRGRAWTHQTGAGSHPGGVLAGCSPSGAMCEADAPAQGRPSVGQVEVEMAAVPEASWLAAVPAARCARQRRRRGGKLATRTTAIGGIWRWGGGGVE
jgi:hypothetical protein